MRTVVFINSHSRRSSRYLEDVRVFFDKHKQFDVVDYIVVEDLKSFDKYLKRLQSHKNIDCVIAGGGDGTIMTIINVMKNHKNLTFGFLPLGTTNIFARNMGLPRNPKKALQVLTYTHARNLNLGSNNGRLFISSTGLGLTVSVVKQMKNRFKRLLGPWSYYFLGLKMFINYQPIQCEVKIGDKVTKFQTYDLIVLTGPYFGIAVFNKDSSIYDDQLTILYSTDTSRLGYMKDVHSFVIGRQYHRRNIHMLTAPKLTLKTNHPEQLQVDGELDGKTPADIRIIKDAIRVFVPPDKS